MTDFIENHTAIIFGVTVVVLLWLFSYIAPRLVQILHETRTVSRMLIAEVLTTWVKTLRVRVESIINGLRREPVKPYLFELKLLTAAVNNLGSSQIERLGKIEERLSRDLKIITSASQQPALRLEQGSSSLEDVGHGKGDLLLYVLLILAVAIFNSWLLGLFFSELLPTDPTILFKPIHIRVSNILAIAFSIIEVVSGTFLHASARRGVENVTAHRFLQAIPIIVISSLALVELVAYGVLANSMNIAGRLGIPPEHGFYAIIQYFLSPIGGAVTLVLAGLGYLVWSEKELIRKQRRYKLMQLSKTRLQYLDDLQKNSKGMLENVRNEAAALQDVRSSVVKRLDQILDSVRDRLRGEEAVEVLRSKAEFRIFIAGKLLILSIWLIVAYVLVVFFSDFFAGTVQSSGLHLLLAAGLTLGLAATGYMLQEAYKHRIQSEKRSRSRSRFLEWAWLYLLLAISVAGVILSGYITMSKGIFASTDWLNFTFGAFVALLILVLSKELEYGLSVAVILGTLIFFGILFCLAYAFVISLSVINAIVYLLGQIIRIAAIPGDLIRGLFRKREAPVGP
jgi:hypothetical protein